jgi:transcriptional regulator with XRE-family HTH domain
LENTSKRDRSTFIKNVIVARKAKGWSASTLAEKAGVPYPTLRDLESGRNYGRHETKEAIAAALGKTVDELNQVAGAAPSTSTITPEDIISLIDPILKIAGVSQDKRGLILALVLEDASYFRTLSPSQIAHAQSLLKVL